MYSNPESMTRTPEKKSLLVLSLIMAVFNISAMAQEKRIDISAFVGYTFSSTIEVDQVLIGDGRAINKVGPKSSLSWGLQGDYNITNRIGVGFLWDRQKSKFRAEIDFFGEDRSTDFANMAVYNYHGVFTYHFADRGSNFRPFVFGGFGATNYSPSSFSGIDAINFDSEVAFSATWGGGLKVFPRPSLGFKLMGRWTPTRVLSDPEGIWCNPRFDCFLVGESQRMHQLEFSGGVLFRF